MPRSLKWLFDLDRATWGWTRAARLNEGGPAGAPLGSVVEQHYGATVSTFDYDPVGRIVRATNADAELAFDRDPRGRIVAETCNGRTLTSSYDALGRRTHCRTPLRS